MFKRTKALSLIIITLLSLTQIVNAKITIYIRGIGNAEHSLTVEETDTIENIKAQLRAVVDQNVPPELVGNVDFQLLFSGEALAIPTMSVKDAKITASATLTLQMSHIDKLLIKVEKSFTDLETTLKSLKSNKKEESDFLCAKLMFYHGLFGDLLEIFSTNDQLKSAQQSLFQRQAKKFAELLTGFQKEKNELNPKKKAEILKTYVDKVKVEFPRVFNFQAKQMQYSGKALLTSTQAIKDSAQLQFIIRYGLSNNVESFPLCKDMVGFIDTYLQKENVTKEKSCAFFALLDSHKKPDEDNSNPTDPRVSGGRIKPILGVLALAAAIAGGFAIRLTPKGQRFLFNKFGWEYSVMSALLTQKASDLAATDWDKNLTDEQRMVRKAEIVSDCSDKEITRINEIYKGLTEQVAVDSAQTEAATL